MPSQGADSPETIRSIHNGINDSPTQKRHWSQSPDRQDGNQGSPRAKKPLQQTPQENDDLPQPFDAKKLQPAKKRQRSTSPGGGTGGPGESGPRKQRRPGRRARITEADREQIRQRTIERERALAAEDATLARGPLSHGVHALQPHQLQQTRPVFESRAAIDDVVREHYNAVPQHGREWRKTESRIKGLRSFNNWVKSCVIQKFTPDEDHAPGAREHGLRSSTELLVLDIGCGKGGDLGKWLQAPQKVQLYVGLDPAEVSIEQARERFRDMGYPRGGRGGYRGAKRDNRRRSPPFEAFFHVKDCFGESLVDLDIIRQVGFSTRPNMSSSTRGFDVVSMMFCMHYAFETEEKARQMLRNVAGALKKGGRFMGTIPNSDVIGAHVVEFNKQLEERKRKRAEEKRAKAEADAETEMVEVEQAGLESAQGMTNEEAATRVAAARVAMGAKDIGFTEVATKQQEAETPEEGEVPDDDAPTNEPKKQEGAESEAAKDAALESATAEWGNEIYRVRFPGRTPADGIFRPPFGWKYSFFLHEAVEEVPEYVVPWHAFRALAEDYNLELQYHKTFREVWETEKDDRELGSLSERMGVRERDGSGRPRISDEEMEAAGLYVAFCFYKV